MHNWLFKLRHARSNGTQNNSYFTAFVYFFWWIDSKSIPISRSFMRAGIFALFYPFISLEEYDAQSNIINDLTKFVSSGMTSVIEFVYSIMLFSCRFDQYKCASTTTHKNTR